MEFEEMTTADLWAALPETDGFERGQLLLHLMGKSKDAHEHVTALSLAQQAAQTFQEGGFLKDYALAKAYQASCHNLIDEVEQAVDCLTEALANMDPSLDAISVANMHSDLGAVHKKVNQDF
jgi:tetratricopeptide (TPR) repeat protein